MKISTRGRYALRMMIDIAFHSNGSWVPLKRISARQEISIKYLEQIVSSLMRAHLLISSRGPQGGYMLTRKPKEYTIGEILRSIEGNLAPVACMNGGENTCGRHDCCSTIEFWQGLHTVVNTYLDSITLAELTKKSYGGCADYSI